MDELRAGVKKMLGEFGPREPRKRYPKGLLEKVLSYTVARRRQGAKLIEVGEELGIGFKTLSRWLGRSDKPRRFQRVEMVSASVPVARALILHAPKGLRIEGLDIDSVAELVKRLGG